MRRFRGFIKKEFNHILRDFRTLLILFGMPAVQLLIFGYVVTNELKDIRIAVFDQSKDQYSRDITNKIMASEYFIFEGYLESTHAVEEKFREGNIKQVIIFEPGFGQQLIREKSADIQLLADASDANTANLVVSYTSAIIQDYLSELNQSSGVGLRILPEIRMLYNENMAGAYMFVPGVMALILMIVSALMTSVTITREKELGTMETLLVSPLRPAQIIVGKVAPYVMLSFVNAVTIVAMGYFVFGLPVHGSLGLLLLESLLFISVALSLGIFISTLVETQQMAMFISLIMLMLPTILLSGFIFPVENMPRLLQWLSFIVPAKYFIIIVKSIMLKGTGLGFIWKETLVLVFMMLFFLANSVRRFKTRLE
jgi:ABC-2 type transport system permease protein